MSADATLAAAIEAGDDPLPLGARGRALVSYATKLTRAPSSVTEADLAELRSAGLSDGGLHDAAAVVSYYNFVNRMALGLGVELEE